MKLIKQIGLGVLIAVSAYCAIVYTSCTKDACKTVVCLNGGTCSSGVCTCDTSGGIGGTNCQTVYRELYGGQGGMGQSYVGGATITYPSLDTAQRDSGYANRTDANDSLTFSYGSDSTYRIMHLVWSDNGTDELSASITLVTNTTAGSTFSVTPTSGGPNGAYTFSGGGTVSTIGASLNLVGVSTNTEVPTVYVNLSNCVLQ